METFSEKQVLFVGFKDKFFEKVLKNLKNGKESHHLIFSSSENKESKNTIYAQFLVRTEDIVLNYADFLGDGIDLKFLTNLSECRLFFNRTIDRTFLDSPSSRESDQYFYTLVEFWISFFKKSPKIKDIFFEASPHFPWDICLFFVAKELNINTFVLRRSLINDCVIFDTDFRPQKQQLVKFDHSFNGGFELDQLLSSFTKDSYWLEWSKSLTNVEVDLNSTRKSLLYLLSRRVFTRIRFVINDLIDSKKTYFRLSKLDYIFFTIKRFFQQKKLHKFWNDNTKEIPKNVPLLYFPLHFQPERSTDPEAGFFSQQILAIKLLIKILPEEWNIVLKEHPRQNRFEYPNLRRIHYRSLAEYKEIFKLKRVIPVSSTIPSSELLELCRLSAACTGSILWESLLHGKPSISFGTTWHSDCESSPLFYDIENNPLVLSQLLSKDNDQVMKDVEDFLIRNYKSFINSSNSEQFAEQSNLNINLLALNLSEAIDFIVKKNDDKNY